MTIRWITPLLGTAPADTVRDLADVTLIDVRDLVDKAGNRPDAVKEKIMSAVQSLQKGMKTVVCCDYGISRSNAIAAGILATHGNISFLDAVQVVQDKTGEKEIKLELLDIVRRATESGEPKTRTGDKPTVLVTGARGFLGSAACQRLRDHFSVLPLSREQVDIEEGSARLSLLAEQHDAECIIHLANPRVFTSNIALGKTLTMLRNVLDVCVSQNVHLIYPSGWEIYSGYAGTLIADETLPAFPRGPYGETKYLAELMIEHWRKTADVRCTILRSGPVYGLGSQKPKFIYNFMDKARRSEPIVTHRYLNGNPALDLLHVDDFIDAIVRACREKYVGAMNIGTGTLTSTFDIAEKLRDAFASKSSIEQSLIESYTARIAMNCHKARQILGWQPKVSFNDGLHTLIAGIS